MDFRYQVSREEREAAIRMVGEYYIKHREGKIKWLERHKQEKYPIILQAEVESLGRRRKFYSQMRINEQAIGLMLRLLVFGLMLELLIGGGRLMEFLFSMSVFTLVTAPVIWLVTTITEETMKDIMTMMTVLASVYGVATPESEKELENSLRSMAADTLTMI